MNVMKRLTPTLGSLSILGLIVSLSGCGTLINTPYTAPKLEVASQWANQNKAHSLPAMTDKWWESFNDPQLNRLIEAVLKENNDLAVATIKVRKAQLNADLAHANFLPTPSASVSTSSSRNVKSGGSSTRSNTTSLSLSYEADLWGKLGSEYDEYKWEAQATQQDMESTRLSLIGTTIDLYWKQAYYKEIIALSEDNIAYYEKTLALLNTQRQTGYVSDIDVLTAQQNLASAKSTHTQYVESQRETDNSMKLLFNNHVPPEASNPPRLTGTPIPEVDAGLPAELLSRRPDLRAAELRLREDLAAVNYTRASYYPSLTLTGSLGTSSSSLSNLLSNPVGTLAADLSLPFLQWNTMKLNVKISQATYDAAVVSFRSTLYSALNDVENALSSRTQYLAQADQLKQSLTAAEKMEKLYQVQYQTGYVSLQTLLDARYTRRTAQISLAANQLNLLDSQVTLYQALGGSAKAEQQ